MKMNMKEKTIEEKKAAVLAFVERVCPNDGQIHYFTELSYIKCYRASEDGSVWWDFFTIKGGSSVHVEQYTIYEPNVGADWTYILAYSNFGIETADAVEEAKELIKFQSDQIERITARNAALVAAVQKEASAFIKWQYEDGERPDFECMIIRLEKAIEANKKGGNEV